jgi:hypothetical protein
MDERVYQVLQEYGLNTNEITIYLESLKHDEISPFKLANLTHIPRTTVYDVLMSLSLKGLIELIHSTGLEKQQTRVRAKNPSIIRKYLADKRKDLVKLEIDVLDILPDLKKDFHKGKANSDFKLFPGITGANEVYDKLTNIDYALPVYAFTNLMPADAFGRKRTDDLIDAEFKKRAKVNTKAKQIIPLTEWTKHVLTYQYGRDNNYLKYNEFRYVDNPIFSIHQDLNIVADKIFIVTAEEDEIWGMIINSQTLSKSLTSIFHLIWQIATPLTQELVESWGENEFLKAEKNKTAKEK